MSYPKLTPIIAKGASEPRYLEDRFAEVINVKDFGVKGDGTTDDTNAIRAVFDYALDCIKTWRIEGAVVYFPAGGYLVSDELFSDEFQQWIWEHSYTERHLTIQGAGNANSIILVSSNWVSGVRNQANGNERTYGPWANSPSPSILFPIIQDASRGNPLVVSLHNLRIRKQEGSSVGRDPIPFFVRTELDARHSNIEIHDFANWGEVVMGSYNSNRSNIKIIGCGQQPSEVGKSFSNIPAGFTSNGVLFNYVASTRTATARAGVATQGYAKDAPIPFFKQSHVGKKFFLSHADQGSQPLETVVESVSNDGYSAVLTTVATYGSPQDTNDCGGSFTPVKVSGSAGSTSITLSSPICFGRGARDMVGMMVAIPNVRSASAFPSSLFISRIASCDVGNDTDGYTVVSLTEPLGTSVSGEDFITGASHFCGYDERALLDAASHAVWSVNDTDWVNCQWENANDGLNNWYRGSSYMFLNSRNGGAIQYVSCKVHGANPTYGQFACDGSIIFDGSSGIDLIGFNATHSICGNGTIRFIGRHNKVYITNINFDDWRMPKSFKAFKIDPITGWTVNNFKVVAKNIDIQNPIFVKANFNNIYFRNKDTVTINQFASIIQGSDYAFDEYLLKLESGDDINSLYTQGIYWIGSQPNIPDNIPYYGQHAHLEIQAHELWARQLYIDFDNIFSYERYYRYINAELGWQWTPWKTRNIVQESVENLGDKSSAVNLLGKDWLSFAYNTTDGKLYLGMGDSPTSKWHAVDGSNEITPS